MVGGGRPMSQIDACTGYTHWRRPWGWRVDIFGWNMNLEQVSTPLVIFVTCNARCSRGTIPRAASNLQAPR